MSEPAVSRMLFPAIRWDTKKGFAPAAGLIDEALELGVGGFIVFGGEAVAVRELTGELTSRSTHPLLIGADLERGAGQQFAGATPLPPLAALGFVDDEGITRHAGHLTAREARALGVNWIYGPVADVDFEPRNPIVGTRSFGIHHDHAARHVVAWIDGCHEGRALACAKHFPGHGRTTADSHVELPEVLVDAATLEKDLDPFRAAIRVGVDTIMTAHVSYPALDVTGAAATLSSRILTTLLRERMEFRGLIVTDAMNMEGVIESGAGEASASVRAVAAGCDALLYPSDLKGATNALRKALGKALPHERVADACARIDRAARNIAEPETEDWGRPADHAWAVELGARAVHAVRGAAHFRSEIDLFCVDDDVGGPYPPPERSHFVNALRAEGVEVTEIDSAAPGCVVAVFCDIRAWKKRPGLSETSVASVDEAIAGGASLVVLFGHPRIAAQIKGADLVSAWGGEPIMQEAAARWLSAQRGA